MNHFTTTTLIPLNVDTAQPPADELLAASGAALGFIPNMYRTMANAPGLLDTYLHGYKQFRSLSGLTPAEQEVVFLTISVDNGCEYCVAAHSTIADTASKLTPAVTDAIRAGGTIPDARLAALAEATRTVLHSRGRPSERDLASFFAAGYSEQQLLAVVLAIAVKALSNYTNHLVPVEVDTPFRRRVWSVQAETRA